MHEKYIVLSVIRETRIKTTIKYHQIPTRTAKIKNNGSTTYWRGWEATKTLIVTW